MDRTEAQWIEIARESFAAWMAMRAPGGSTYTWESIDAGERDSWVASAKRAVAVATGQIGAQPQPQGANRGVAPTDLDFLVQLHGLRDDGWQVAVHNDYRISGERFTFWGLTKGSRWVKGEGRTDAEAIAECLGTIDPSSICDEATDGG